MIRESDFLLRVSRLISILSGILNRVLFGARVWRDKDQASQYTTICIAYGLNLSLIFAPTLAIWLCFGGRNILQLEMWLSDISFPLALSNSITFFAMYVASVRWSLDDNSMRSAATFFRWQHTYLLIVVILSGVCFLFTAVQFLNLGFYSLLASLLINSGAILGSLEVRSISNIRRNDEA